MTEENNEILPVGLEAVGYVRKEKEAFEKWYKENVHVWTTSIERIARQAWRAGVEWCDQQERI